MRVKSNISFCGSVCMAAGEIRDIPEGGVLTDLLNAGYVERLESEPVDDNSAEDKPLDKEPAGDKAADEEPEPVTEKPKGAKNEAKRGKSD